MVVPLKIILTDSTLLADEGVKLQVDKLEKAGHSIVIDDSLKAYDFISGPNCWLLRPEVAGLFSMAVANARKVANADTQRMDQIKATKARKVATRRTNKISSRSAKAKAVTGSGGSGGENSDGTPARTGSRIFTQVKADLGDVIPGGPQQATLDSMFDTSQTGSD